jgi:hypothetical protein
MPDVTPSTLAGTGLATAASAEPGAMAGSRIALPPVKQERVDSKQSIAMQQRGGSHNASHNVPPTMMPRSADSGSIRAKKRRRIGSPEDVVFKTEEHRQSQLQNGDSSGRDFHHGEHAPSHGKNQHQTSGKGKGRPIEEDVKPVANGATSLDHANSLAVYRAEQKAKEERLVAEREQRELHEKARAEKEKTDKELKMAKGEIAFKNSVCLEGILSDVLRWQSLMFPFPVQTILAQTTTIDTVKQSVTCNVCLEMFTNPHV